MMVDRFTLESGCWYGLTMFPGYLDYPYHSPIRVDGIEQLGKRVFELRFVNLCYAAGVQDFLKRLRTLRRASSHLVAEETEVEDRTYVITSLNRPWLQAHFPFLIAERFFDPNGCPDNDALLSVSTSAFPRA